ncbi:hypothetical protein ATY81_02420 [Rhizobium sp. R72]|uniref:L,D-transpeptidase n=1 Tax=unclassified Rhizobium TaxID=2613769 RepID=UPI000B52D911|nr:MULTISPECIES: L,D-transpeptidase [unclassified Rhizobium]OWW04847.1 hypothetical protein ATY81_02420 [Rhizobium sp. R72]OWW05904.1 hypothetical protein ATY80_02420 [Rhizobium sp. R711]
MKLVALFATALLLITFQAQAQIYGPYDDYGDYGYVDPYGPYGPPDYGEPMPEYRPRARSGGGTIVIATREHTLVYTTPQGDQLAYPIAVGREGKQWYGTTHVVSKRKHPEWRPTASMRRKNPKLPDVMMPGPSNPLGTRAIYLADGLLRIHGTNDPSSIGTNASSGCFRMYREDVEELYEMVRPGTRVIVQR